MGSKKTITIINKDKDIEDVELICAFSIPELTNKFIIYTKGEKDNDSNTIIYLGKIIAKNGTQQIENIDDNFEWPILKDILKLMSKYSLEGEYNVQ